MNIYNGKFYAPVDGLYFFYSQTQSFHTSGAKIEFYVNGSRRSHAFNNGSGPNPHSNRPITGYYMVTLSSQFKLNAGDTVWVKFWGYYNNPRNALHTFYEGHLIHKLNS